MNLRPGHDGRVLLLALAAGLPALIACIVLLAIGGYPERVQWAVDIGLALCWIGFAAGWAGSSPFLDQYLALGLDDQRDGRRGATAGLS